MRCRILDSINKIGQADWDEIFGDIPEGYQFYKTLEESGLTQFTFYYVTIHSGKKIILVAPLFIADFNLDIAMDGFSRKAVQRIRRLSPNFFVMRTLFCGSPFGENGILGIREDWPDKDALLKQMLKAMNRLCKRNNAHFLIFKDFLKENTEYLDGLTGLGFFKTTSLPSIVTKADFDSMEDYFKGLSYSKRKDLRRKLRKAFSGGRLRIEERNDVGPMIDEVYALYINTYRAGKIKFERLSKEFFINIAKNMNHRARFFLYYVNGRLAAFNLCLIHKKKDIFIDKFIGFDYDLSRKYSLYFVSWCFNVERCIKESISNYQSGQTDYKPKLSLGGKRVSLYAYVRHRNPLWHMALKLIGNIDRP